MRKDPDIGGGSPKKQKKKGKPYSGITRREFLRNMGILGSLAALGEFTHLASLAATQDVEQEERQEQAVLPRRPLGQMGFNASILGMGGIRGTGVVSYADGVRVRLADRIPGQVYLVPVYRICK